MSIARICDVAPKARGSHTSLPALGTRDVPPPLAVLLQRGVLSWLDVAFARTAAGLVAESRVEVLLAAALASAAVERGHVCLDLRRLRSVPLTDPEGAPVFDVTLPAHDEWRSALRDSALVSDGSEPRPLVLDAQGRLYLARLYHQQAKLAANLAARAKKDAVVDIPLLRDGLARLFPQRAAVGRFDSQRLAAILAVSRKLTVICGGPGTGKTTTVLRVLALLQEQALRLRQRPQRIALMAPTGKAASRLGESIASQLDALDASPEARASLAIEASTIHRALGFQSRTPTRFRHDREHPLGADVVVVDEASMIDLALMAKLVDAVSAEAHLVLVGDKDQLASVEAGAILGDIWGPLGGRAYSQALHARYELLVGEPLPMPVSARPAGIQDSMVELTESFRYQASSGISALARAVNDGDGDRAVAVLRGDGGMPYGEVALVELIEHRPLAGPLGATVVEGFSPYLSETDPGERLARLSRFRVLCAHRRGPLGVESINALIEAHLERAGLISIDGPVYDGRPVLVMENDYQLGLFNGDVGVVAEPDGGPRRVFFATGAGLRAVHPARLPPHETVFAMTVHKSQGSELDRVALLLPERLSPILTRELVYTAVSRARQRVDLYGDEQVLRQAIVRRIERASGLSEALSRW